MKQLVIYTSLTGNTKTFVDYLISKSKNDVDVGDFSTDISSYNRIAIGTYTWGNGNIPRKMKKFLIENKDNFKDKEIFLFGSGNSVYPKFCGAVNGMKIITTDCGASIIGEFKFEQRFNPEELTNEDHNLLNNIITKWNG
ncbi:flavodoxin domain-containing protein [Staphylococcus equorum]|uniref:Flavodoxin domain-containing protein n=1 Tax=Staphylococcus equorum TaxID=246432 RepID=A0A9X4LAQ7_9STAP|nr:flavodoxin domain-containing protein [Staphylococcus equorum]MDG0860386.1 flavodoxin domain-containing protein [Staphylococcus equorum]